MPVFQLAVARQLLDEHHGTPSDMALKQNDKISQNAWQCNNCKEEWMYPNKPKCIRCGRANPKNPLFFLQTARGKAVAKKQPRAKNGGGTSKDDKEVEKLRDDAAKEEP